MRSVLFSFAVIAVISCAIADRQGGCGNNLHWRYEEATFTLTINGTLAMNDFDLNLNLPPWYDVHVNPHVATVIIEPGATSIGNYAFASFSNLTSITIPDTVTWFGKYAFRGCHLLQQIPIPSGVSSIGEGCFYQCSNVTELIIPDDVPNLEKETFHGCE